MTRTRRSRTKGSAKSQGKDRKARDYKKDVDQIHEELERQAKGLPRVPANDTTVQEVDSEELPGGGDYPCISCSRYFISPDAHAVHLKTKVHKRRVKQLKEEPYSQAEADRAAGLGVDNKRKSSSATAEPAQVMEVAEES